MNTRSQTGFTLLELLVTLTVAGVILGIGVPNLMEFQRNNAIAGASNDFVTAVLSARSEAVKRQVPVSLCATNDPLAEPPTCAPTGTGTNGGFVVWVDEDDDPATSTTMTDASDGDIVIDADERVLRRIEAPGGAIDVFLDGGYIAYAPNGFTRDPGVDRTTNWVLYCDDRGRGVAAGGLSAARAVRIRETGRAEVLRDMDLIDQAVTAISSAGATVNCPE